LVVATLSPLTNSSTSVRKARFQDVGGMNGNTVSIKVGGDVVCHCSFVSSNNSCFPVRKYRFQEVG